jgi:hypothetical protein
VRNFQRKKVETPTFQSNLRLLKYACIILISHFSDVPRRGFVFRNFEQHAHHFPPLSDIFRAPVKPFELNWRAPRVVGGGGGKVGLVFQSPLLLPPPFMKGQN